MSLDFLVSDEVLAQHWGSIKQKSARVRKLRELGFYVFVSADGYEVTL